MRPVSALLIVASASATCFGQLGTGEIWYEASADNGNSWYRNYLGIGPETPSVLVRVVASWSRDAGMYAFAGAQFDVRITEAAADSVTEMQRTWPFYVGSTQTLVATHFGSTIKIDDARDTLGPGAGTRGVFPGQLVEQFAWTNFSSANPATIFQFRLNFGDATVRDLSSLYIAPSGGDSVSRYMRVYTSSSGGQNTPTTITHGMTIDNLTPAPGGGAILAIVGLAAAGRRSRHRPIST